MNKYTKSPRFKRGYKSHSSRFQTAHRGQSTVRRGGYGRNSRKNPYQDSYIAEEMYVSRASESHNSALYKTEETFADYALTNTLKQNILQHGYKYPTQIQAETIPHILQGKDILGIANTGSGKTAAFLVPIINNILSHKNKKCLIVAPTRELVNQIQSEFRLLAQNTNLRDVVVVGGASYSTQIRILKRDPHFVIATPGRLIDLCNNKYVDLSTFDTVVLDEVDQMLDMGFIHDVKAIISQLKSPRQSLFFSATITGKIKDIVTSLLNAPVVVEIASQTAAKSVEQNVVRVGGKNKSEVLHDLLINTDIQKALVFSRTKRQAEQLARWLQTKGHKCDALHGNKSLSARTKILGMFKRDEITVLVATDVASRGIDVPDISHVINYDQPATYSDYIHRIGRTGRIGKKGNALTFV
jgi:ATP-dependent RNA helicase RhlE